MNKILNIVSFDNPYPPNYGGVIDVYYKIKALSDLGVSIHLHYFADKERNHEALDEICSSVTYYPKSSLLSKKLLSNLPLRMIFRQNKSLISNLATGNYPVLYEGLHTSYSARDSQLSAHKKYLRCHNAEAEYALHLSRTEKNPFKKLIFQLEAKRTEQFEKTLTQFDGLYVLSKEDRLYFNKANSEVKIIPIFHGHKEIKIKEGIGDYVLFHGNLTVNENLETAKWIIKEIAPQLTDVQFVIAGKGGKGRIKGLKSQKNVTCVANPSHDKMTELIQNAQCILLKTNVPSGVKLKLIDSLALGRHIIADDNTVQNVGINQLVHRANTSQEYISKIKVLKQTPTPLLDKILRNILFKETLNNEMNASLLIQDIFR